ncbi:MAG: PAS domain-containing protein [Rhodospirillaceae bacterium]|nr:PAS domain-containing protein [Rhodospirillaceae bacterium]
MLSPASLRRLLAWAIGPCIPGWAVLLGLALVGRLSWTVALVSCGVVFLIMAALVLTRLADFDRVIRYAEELLLNPEAPAPLLETSATARRLLSGLTALRKLWADRRDEADALARSRQDILDSLPDPFFLLDRKRRVVSANAAARALFEIERITPSLAGRDLASVIRDPKVLEAADVALTQNRKTEAQFTLPAPVEHSFAALIVPVQTAGSDGAALIIALHDQTERLKMDRMRADFVANASHELRTPLASVLGFIETLQGPAKDDEKARGEFLDIMLKQANRMTRLIDDLLSLSRIELREHARPTDAVDMELLLRNAVELLDRQIKERRSAVSLQLPPHLPAAVGDANELSQVFHNLISNAVKYGGDQGRVEITAAISETRPPAMPGKGTCLRISVRDYGEGIAREHIPRLTERFYRVDTARSRLLGGTGLGLAIVKHITNRHRGALVVESELGKGATFTVYLPIAAA